MCSRNQGSKPRWVDPGAAAPDAGWAGTGYRPQVAGQAEAKASLFCSLGLPSKPVQTQLDDLQDLRHLPKQEISQLAAKS